MTIAIDQSTRDTLRGISGEVVSEVRARRYPKPSLFDRIELVFASGRAVSIRLEEVEVGELFEVFRVTCHGMSSPMLVQPYDVLLDGQHIVSEVNLLRRGEWVEPTDAERTLDGSRATIQSIGHPQTIPLWREHCIVDSGVLIVMTDGLGLVFDADSFPLLLQFHVTRDLASLTDRERVPLEEVKA